MVITDAAVIAGFGLIAAIATISGPIILVQMQNSNRRRERIEDYKRQDEVAERAKKAADELLRATKDAASLADGKLSQIHTLVNSNVTTQMQLTLTASEAQLAAMKDAMEQRGEGGHEPIAAMVAALEKLEHSIADQKSALEERKLATDAAAAQLVSKDTHGLTAAADKIADAAETMGEAASKASDTAAEFLRKP